MTKMFYFIFLRFYLLIIPERHTQRERERERGREREGQRHRQREKQVPRREPDMELDSRTPGLWPEPKADTQPLSHSGVPRPRCFREEC